MLRLRQSMIHTARLTIRPFTLRDLDALHAIYGDAEVMRWVEGSWGSVEQTAAALERHVASGHWSAVEDASGALVGEVGLEPHAEHVEIGWTFARAAWGRGYATEAAGAVLAAAGPRPVVALIHPRNAASIRVAEKLGLVCTARRGARWRYERGANVRDAGL